MIKITGKVLLMLGLFIPFFQIVKGWVRCENAVKGGFYDEDFELYLQLVVTVLIYIGVWLLIW